MRTNSEITSSKPLSAQQTHLVISGALLAVAFFAGIACHVAITADESIQISVTAPDDSVDIS